MTSTQRVLAMGRAISFEQITLNASTADTLTVPVRIYSCLITADGANVRWRADGGAATSSVGHLLVDGQSIEFFGDDVDSLSIIATTGTPTVAVTYFN